MATVATAYDSLMRLSMVLLDRNPRAAFKAKAQAV